MLMNNASNGARLKLKSKAVHSGVRERAKHGRTLCRYNLPFGSQWQNRFYPIKQVAPVIKEEANEIVVITVYTFYF